MTQSKQCLGSLYHAGERRREIEEGKTRTIEEGKTQGMWGRFQTFTVTNVKNQMNGFVFSPKLT